MAAQCIRRRTAGHDLREATPRRTETHAVRATRIVRGGLLRFLASQVFTHATYARLARDEPVMGGGLSSGWPDAVTHVASYSLRASSNSLPRLLISRRDRLALSRWLLNSRVVDALDLDRAFPAATQFPCSDNFEVLSSLGLTLPCKPTMSSTRRASTRKGRRRQRRKAGRRSSLAAVRVSSSQRM